MGMFSCYLRARMNPLNRKIIKAKKPIVIQRTAVATEKKSQPERNMDDNTLKYALGQIRNALIHYRPEWDSELKDPIHLLCVRYYFYLVRN